MALRPEFDRYLEHFGETVPIAELHAEPERRGVCALRHDVDHDLDIALEMAHREHRYGARATYYILPTASYWNDPYLIDKCLQLQDYGHEVGLHLNCLAQWAGGETDDPAALLREQLVRLREGGVDIIGTSAHGDRLCYEHNVSNYWCFRELRPADPVKAEDGRTAEGPFEADGRPRLAYPADHHAVRPDGARFPLWSMSMADLGLRYHAWHTRFDRYFSDSGGSWTRTPDPLRYSRGEERWQVLIHPIHWLGPRRIFFFLSTARSGSRWLAEVLERATPLTARHEYMLNQDFHRGETAQKATAAVRALQDRPEEVRARLTEAWEELDGYRRDYAEVNVYLESFADELKRIFPDAIYVHLHRDPALVVRSLMDRDWYDTPEDHAHPKLVHRDPAGLDRFGRVCLYVAEACMRLRQVCNHQLALDDLVKSPESLASALESLDIPYHPRLGQAVARQVINANRQRTFPKFENWTPDTRRTYLELCGDCAADLGYISKASLQNVRRSSGDRRLCNQRLVRNSTPPRARVEPQPFRVAGFNCDAEYESADNRLTLRPHGVQHAYATLGGSTWGDSAAVSDGRIGRLRRFFPFWIRQQRAGETNAGWRARPGAYVRGTVTADLPKGASCALFALSYREDGTVVHRRQLGALDGRRPSLKFAFAPHPDAYRFDVAVYISKLQPVGLYIIRPYLEVVASPTLPLK